MRTAQLEALVLDVRDRIAAGQEIEDSRIELKAEWPSEHHKAARRLAGHANAARGEDVIWIIGLDPKRGVTGADAQDLAQWWPQVCSHFHDVLPVLLMSFAVPTDGKTVYVMLFDTSQAPFTVKVPNVSGVAAELEVPWRDGTRVRSATRADLLRLLMPVVKQPAVDLLGVDLRLRPFDSSRVDYCMSIVGSLFVMPPSGCDALVMPFHRCGLQIRESESSAFQCADFRCEVPSRPKSQIAGQDTPEPRDVVCKPGEAVLRIPATLRFVATAGFSGKPSLCPQLGVDMSLAFVGVDGNILASTKATRAGAEEYWSWQSD